MPSCMGQFVNQDGAEFTWIEQPVDAGGKQDAGRKNTANGGTGVRVAEAH